MEKVLYYVFVITEDRLSRFVFSNTREQEFFYTQQISKGSEVYMGYRKFK